MFKLTGKSGLRRSGGSGRSAGPRVNASVMRDSGREPIPGAAFHPDTQQERTFDNDSNPRLQGLEKRIKY